MSLFHHSIILKKGSLIIAKKSNEILQGLSMRKAQGLRIDIKTKRIKVSVAHLLIQVMDY